MQSIEWRPVVGYEDLYEVSSTGRVRSLTRSVPHFAGGTARREGVEITPRPNPRSAYLQVDLRREGARQTLLLHRVVAAAFCDTSNGPAVRHLDGNPRNNTPSNLRWGTLAENQQDSVAHGTKRNRYSNATHCVHGHEFTDDNTYRPPSGGRSCRTCTRVRNREWYANNRRARLRDQSRALKSVPRTGEAEG